MGRKRGREVGENDKTFLIMLFNKAYGWEKFQYTQRYRDPFATVSKLKLRVTGSSCSICEGLSWLFPMPTWAATTSVAAAVIKVPPSMHVVAGTAVALVRNTPMGRSRNSRKNTGRGAMRIWQMQQLMFLVVFSQYVYNSMLTSSTERTLDLTG